jgi:hypothetical protein
LQLTKNISKIFMIIQTISFPFDISNIKKCCFNSFDCGFTLLLLFWLWCWFSCIAQYSNILMLLLLVCFTCVITLMVLLISCYYYGCDVDIVVLHNIQVLILLNYSFVVDVMVLLSYLCKKCSIENYVHFHLNLPPNFPPNYLLSGNTIIKQHLGWIQLWISIA